MYFRTYIQIAYAQFCRRESEITAVANSTLGNARLAKNDEFYTQYPDIEKEVNAYLDFDENVFRDKTILLPCDDPEWSNFTKYFAQNFQRFGIKKLISTSFAPASRTINFLTQPTLFETESPQFDELKTKLNGKIFVLQRDKTGDGRIDSNDLEWEYLEGDGDFRSSEICRLRDEADIVITNPPFSLFREFLGWIVNANKQFVIIGNKNAITYKEVFPLIMDNKLWLGSTSMGADILFAVPDALADNLKKSGKEGSKWRIVGGVLYARASSTWFTNLDHGRRHQPLSLMTAKENLTYSKHKELKEFGYRQYDNYEAIEVPFTDSIPSDYPGVMGVPISFLDKYNPDQFEILGATQRGCHDLVPDTRKYDDYWECRPDGTRTGSSGGKTNENANLLGNDGKKNYFINKRGRVVQSAYQRIFIRHRRPSK